MIVLLPCFLFLLPCFLLVSCSFGSSFLSAFITFGIRLARCDRGYGRRRCSGPLCLGSPIQMDPDAKAVPEQLHSKKRKGRVEFFYLWVSYETLVLLSIFVRFFVRWQLLLCFSLPFPCLRTYSERFSSCGSRSWRTRSTFLWCTSRSCSCILPCSFTFGTFCGSSSSLLLCCRFLRSIGSFISLLSRCTEGRNKLRNETPLRSSFKLTFHSSLLEIVASLRVSSLWEQEKQKKQRYHPVLVQVD